MCETCDLLRQMYAAIDATDRIMRLKAQDMIYKTNQRIPIEQQYNAAYHKFIGSTPTNEMPHDRMPVIEHAIRSFCAEHNLRLEEP